MAKMNAESEIQAWDFTDEIYSNPIPNGANMPHFLRFKTFTFAFS